MVYQSKKKKRRLCLDTLVIGLPCEDQTTIELWLLHKREQ